MRDWDAMFMQLANQIASWSKDPRHKVGCVAVRDRNILATGFNGFPRGVIDSPARLSDREIKNSLIVHAEANCVAAAARHGHALQDADVYITRPVCSQCAGLLIQAGVVRVVFTPLPRDYMSKWEDSHLRALSIFKEACIIITPNEVIQKS